MKRLRDFLLGEWLLLTAIGVGALIRSYELLKQIPVGDEWHSLHLITKTGFSGIATTFGQTDHSIPISLYFELMTRSVGLGEWTFRAPFWLAGILTVIVVPYGARRYVGKTATTMLGWLLALSPVLIYFSRFARPYALTCLLAWAAVFAIFDWRRTRSRASALVYVVCTVSGGYLHIIALPFVCFLLLALGLDVLCRRPAAWRLRLFELGSMGVLVLLGLAVVLAPPFLKDAASILEKAGSTWPQPRILPELFRLMAGTDAVLPGMVLMVLALAGWFSVARRDFCFAATLVVASIVQVLCAGRSPVAASGAWVLLRYALCILPVMLLFVAAAIAAGLGILRARFLTGGTSPRLALPVVCIGLSAGLFALGPLPNVLHTPNAWMANELRLRLLGRWDMGERQLDRAAFYDRVASCPAGRLLLAEAPWRHAIKLNPLPFIQNVHRQRTVIGFTAGLSPHLLYGELPMGYMKTDFRCFVDLADPAAISGRGIDFVIFHKDLRQEFEPLRTAMSAARFRQTTPDIEACVAIFRERYGEPVYEDDLLVVFEVKGANT